MSNSLAKMTSPIRSQFSTRPSQYRWLCALGCMMLMQHVPALAQEQTSPAATPAVASEQAQDLTEGLLDLLNEPAANPAPDSSQHKDGAASPAAAPSAAKQGPKGTPNQQRQPDQSESRPLSDSRPTGEDIGAPPANPLAEVKLGMVTAADWLRSRSRIDETQSLQSDIVTRLDQLIGELQQQPSRGSASSSTSSASDTSRNPGNLSEMPEGVARSQRSDQGSRPQEHAPPQVPDSETDGNPSAPDSSPSPSPEGSGDSKAGPNGSPASGAMQSRNAVVELNDPTALQRSAWGQLPDRVRDQMQSRMVERFLPRYREEIEAYYRALAK